MNFPKEARPATQKVLLIGLNELNFQFIEDYVELGGLPNFQKMLSEQHLVRTISEKAYPNLEPWIQWVTIHTGLSYDQHKVFRLGDIVDRSHPQIWEVVASRYGASVAAISPMNARNALQECPGALFVPDPWTETSVTAPRDVAMLFRAVKQAVNDNAQNKLALSSIAGLALGILRNVRPSSIASYARMLAGAVKHKWIKALILDRVLADLFITQVKRGQYDFSTLFLNAGAHIQHHYMFSSRCYRGAVRNPEWYIEPGVDPVYEVYRLYDSVLGDVQRAFPTARLIVCTGLSQRANERLIFYYRPKNHRQFLELLGVPFRAVLPRMSRDFLLECDSDEVARSAEAALLSYKARDATPMFTVDNRGKDLFCMLMYTHEIGSGFEIAGNGRVIPNFEKLVSLVSIENGVHQTTGYLIDTGAGAAAAAEPEIPLTEVFARLVKAFEVA